MASQSKAPGLARWRQIKYLSLALTNDVLPPSFFLPPMALTCSPCTASVCTSDQRWEPQGGLIGKKKTDKTLSSPQPSPLCLPCSMMKMKVSRGALSVSNHFKMEIGIKESVLPSEAAYNDGPSGAHCSCKADHGESWNNFSQLLCKLLSLKISY